MDILVSTMNSVAAMLSCILYRKCIWRGDEINIESECRIVLNLLGYESKLEQIGKLGDWASLSGRAKVWRYWCVLAVSFISWSCCEVLLDCSKIVIFAISLQQVFFLHTTLYCLQIESSRTVEFCHIDVGDVTGYSKYVICKPTNWFNAVSIISTNVKTVCIFLRQIEYIEECSIQGKVSNYRPVPQLL